MGLLLQAGADPHIRSNVRDGAPTPAAPPAMPPPRPAPFCERSAVETEAGPGQGLDLDLELGLGVGVAVGVRVRVRVRVGVAKHSLFSSPLFSHLPNLGLPGQLETDRCCVHVEAKVPGANQVSIVPVFFYYGATVFYACACVCVDSARSLEL